LIACDTGPGNALLDDFLRLRTGAPLDTDGRIAASGTIDEKMIERLLVHPFFALPPPKSLDRNTFRGWVGDTLDGIDVENGAATLTALTAAAAARIVPHLPRPPANWIVAGGGAPQPDLAADAHRAACAGARGIGARLRLVDRFTRGAGLRLSGGAQPARSADHGHNGSAAPVDGGRVLARP
jgi:anhydro-N-acetylmuramic acid kinase